MDNHVPSDRVTMEMWQADKAELPCGRTEMWKWAQHFSLAVEATFGGRVTHTPEPCPLVIPKDKFKLETVRRIIVLFRVYFKIWYLCPAESWCHILFFTVWYNRSGISYSYTLEGNKLSRITSDSDTSAVQNHRFDPMLP